MNFIKVKEDNYGISIELNRPEKKNAFHPQMIAEITQAFQKVKSTKARYVLLSGAGESFCAGADLDWMKSMKGYDYKENKADSLKLFHMFETISQTHLPVMASVQGHVMGGANGLLAVCDVVAAVERTQFSFSEVRLGLVPAVISPFVLSKMHKSSARSLMVTGRMFSAQEAYHGGLVEFVGDPQEVENFLKKNVKALLSAGPEAVSKTLALLSQIEKTFDWEEIRELTTDVIAQKRVSSEGQEGLTAFFEKRNPAWWVNS